MKNKSKSLIAIGVILLVIIIDQISKIWVKTNMSLGEMIEITSWFKIYFIENNGMAFGMEVIGKTFLSLFRIIFIGFIGYYTYRLIKRNFSKGYVICVSFIMAGAIGNIIDSLFYGEIFSASYPGKVATLVNMGEGYSTWLHGKVVDMLYFPLFSGTFPTWFPRIGGEAFTFFSPIFNIADSAISVGIFVVILFYRKSLTRSFEK